MTTTRGLVVAGVLMGVTACSGTTARTALSTTPEPSTSTRGPSAVVTTQTPAPARSGRPGRAARDRAARFEPPWPAGLAHTPGDEVQRLGETTYAATYGGDYLIRGRDDRIGVQLTTADPREQAAFRAVAGRDAALTFTVVPTSAAELMALQERVSRAWSQFGRRGIEINSIFTDPARGLVDLTIEKVTPSAVAALDRRFGARNISISQGDAPIATTMAR